MNTTLAGRASWAGVAGGLLGAALGVKDMVVGPRVDPTQLSFPAAPDEVWWTACVLALAHAGAAAGALGVLASDAASGRSARRGLGAAIAGFCAMVPAELAYVPFADAAVESTPGTVISGVMGTAALVSGVGLVVAGSEVMRRRTWSGWRRPVVLAAGVWPVAVLTPVFLTSGWAAWPLVGWQALLTAMSAAVLVQTDRAAAPAPAYGVR